MNAISLDRVRALSETERLLLYLFAFEGASRKIDDFCWALRSRFGRQMTAMMTDQTCQLLVSRGILDCTANCATVPSRKYAFTAQLTFDAARWLIAEARGKGWLPVKGSDISTLAALLDGGRNFRDKTDRYEFVTSYIHNSIWYAAVKLTDMMDDKSVLPEMNFPANTEDRIFRVIASVLFCRGFNVQPILLDWYAKRKRTGWGDRLDADACEYAALCFWTGRMDLLNVFNVGENSVIVNDFVKACVSVSKGDLESAYKLTTGFADLVTSRTHYYAETLYSTPASHLFALTVTTFHKPVKTRISKLALKLCPQKPNFKYDLPSSARDYFGIRQMESAGIIEFMGGWTDGYPEVPGAWYSPTCRMGEVFSAVTSEMTRGAIEAYAPRAFTLAEKAARAGYPSVAALYVSAFGWAFKGDLSEKSKALADAITKAGGAWFRPYDADDGAWKFVVEAFDKCLPTKGRLATEPARANAKSGRIVWAMRLSPQVRTEWNIDDDKPIPESVCACSGMDPCFRGPRCADDGSSDRALTGNALLSGKYDGILTETDRAIISILQKEQCLQRYGCGQPPVGAIKLLCGHDRVTIRRLNTKKGGMLYENTSVVRRDLPMAVKSQPDGGVAITVEPWCLKVRVDHAIRVLPDGTCAFYLFPKQTLAVMEVFKAYGRNGTIDIPKAGMEAMRPLLPRMAALAPIQGELAAVGGGVDLERVPGNAVPLVRLAFADDALEISLWSKPLEESDLVFVPGAGQPERMIAHKGRTAVLVRDLAAEKSGAKQVRTALSEFEAWSNGENEWRVDSLVYSLKALAALKGLGDAARLEWRKGTYLSVVAPKPGSWKLSAVGGVDFWFSVGGEFRLDDGKVLALTELIAAFRARKGEFVRLGENEYLRLTSSILKRLEALESAGRTKGKHLEIPPAALPMLDGVFGAEEEDGGLALPESMEKRIDAVRAALARKVEPPPRLKAELRPYQRDGYEWLSRLAACGMGACLADDMGLGKTVQVIALLLERAHDGASLVVAPASVCGNWRNELARFAPTLRAVMAWDEKADAMDAVNAAGPGDVVIAGYGLLVSRETQFAARTWNGVVLDEAQAIKNETSKRAKAVKRLTATFRVAATGTPVENRLTELWSISDFLNPGLLGSVGDFVRRFTAEGRATPALKRLVSPFILRRVKRDVLEELPEKTEITIPVELGEEERAGYEACRRMALATLEAGGAENRISILAELTRLRRYCCHPSLAMGEAGRVSAKMEALVELLGNLKDNGHRALVFSQFTDYLAIVRNVVSEQGWTHLYLDGQTPAAERERLVNAFQRGDGDFFLISLKAGGTGLNLTAANYVILLDPWWNPAVENQAADRVHRIGQKNPVTVYRLIASGTVEERVVELHREKRALAEDVLDGTGSAALTPEQLMGLFR